MMDERSQDLSLAFSHMLSGSGNTAITVRKREDVAYGDLSNKDYPWEAIFPTAEAAKALSDTFNKAGDEVSWHSICHLQWETGKNRVVFDPDAIMYFIEAEKLVTALAAKLHLTMEEQQRIRIVASPNTLSAIPDVNISINIGPESLNPNDPDNPKGLRIADAICKLIGEPDPNAFWERPERRYEGDDYGLVWRDRYIHPPERLYEALDLPVPDYMRPREKANTIVFPTTALHALNSSTGPSGPH